MNTNMISTVKAFRSMGLSSLAIGLLTVFSAALAYAPFNPGFTIFDTYLSDIGSAPGWPQILFNSGTLIAAPLRIVVLVLLVLRLRSFSEKWALFAVACIGLGMVSSLGTIIMTAVPFSVSPEIHKSGIGPYFLGVVFLQSLIGIREWQLRQLPRILPILSYSIVACYLIFFVLFVLLEMGYVSRSTPVFWEWMCFFSSMIWLAGHSLILGKVDLPM